MHRAAPASTLHFEIAYEIVNPFIQGHAAVGLQRGDASLEITPEDETVSQWFKHLVRIYFLFRLRPNEFSPMGQAGLVFDRYAQSFRNSRNIPG